MTPIERTPRKSCVICLNASQRRSLTKLSTGDNNGVSYLDKIQTLTGLKDMNGFDRHSSICNSCRKELCSAYTFHNRLLTAYNYWNSNSHTDKLGEEAEDKIQELGVSLILPNCEYLKKEDLECDYDDSHSTPLVCMSCQGTFSTSSDMLNHTCKTPKNQMDRTTNYKTLYNCSYCNKTFKRHDMFNEHITVHTGEKNFHCKLCGKAFRRSSSVSRHSRSHQQPPGQKSQKSPFLCNICGKSFPYTNGLQRHMRIHNGVKPHECQFCGNKFRQSTHLQVHLRTHTGEKPYVCEECGDSFSLHATLQKHISNRHRKQAKEGLKCEVYRDCTGIISDF